MFYIIASLAMIVGIPVFVVYFFGTGYETAIRDLKDHLEEKIDEENSLH